MALLKTSGFGFAFEHTVCFSDARCEKIRAAWPDGVVDCERIFDAGTPRDGGGSGTHGRMHLLREHLKRAGLAAVPVSLRANKKTLEREARKHIARMKAEPRASRRAKRVKAAAEDSAELLTLRSQVVAMGERLAALEASEAGGAPVTDPSASVGPAAVRAPKRD